MSADLPPGYITLAEAADRLGVAIETMRRKLCYRVYPGMQGANRQWIGVLASSLPRLTHCRVCTVLLAPDEPGPLCRICEQGGIKLASLPLPSRCPAVRCGHLSIFKRQNR